MSDDMRTAAEWLAGDDHGTSSETIWSVMTGIPVRYYGVPLDWDDFGRCYRLIERFPQWRARLDEVAATHPRWKPIVSAWDRLCELHKAGKKAAVSDLLDSLYVPASNEIVFRVR